MLEWTTDFADQAVVLPVATAVGLLLCLERRWREAGSWTAAIVLVLGAVAVLKMLCAACDWLWPALGPAGLAIRSPSGHAASAAILVGSMGGLLGARGRLGAGPSALLCAVLAGTAIGLTRVALHAHSPAEVVVGAALGVAGALAFAAMLGRGTRAGPPVWALAGAVLVAALQHGHHLAAEPALQGLGAQLVRGWVPACAPD